MSAERVAFLNDFAREKHPGLVGVEVLTCEPELVTGRLPIEITGMTLFAALEAIRE